MESTLYQKLTDHVAETQPWRDNSDLMYEVSGLISPFIGAKYFRSLRDLRGDEEIVEFELVEKMAG